MAEKVGKLARRAMLQGASAIALGLPAAREAAAQQQSPTHADLLQRIAAGRTPQAGRVGVHLPDIVENGSTVPLTVSVESPMTAADHVKTLHVVSDGNPRPEVLVAHFSALSGKAEIATRIRAARSMSVIAYAEMGDGSLWSGRAEATVTIGGCGG